MANSNIDSPEVTPVELKAIDVISLIDEVIFETKNIPLIVPVSNSLYARELCYRLSLTPEEAILIGFFVDNFCNIHITYNNMKEYFQCSSTTILKIDSHIRSLIKKNIIKKRKENGNVEFYMPREAVNALLEGHMPAPEKNTHLKPRQWYKALEAILSDKSSHSISDDEFILQVKELNENNMHLPFVQALIGYRLDDADLKTFLVMLYYCITFRDEHVIEYDLEDYLTEEEMNDATWFLSQGTHPLQIRGLVEHYCANGQAQKDAWSLTTFTKTKIFGDICPKPYGVGSNDLITHDKIKEKKLYYTPKVTKQVQQLHSLLKKRNMDKVLKRLEQHGMRKGFTCLFYGQPGTGKTETVMQLARMSGRDIMFVDIPSIRSKWVGDTERNIKDIFVRYRNQAKASDDIAPILLFNEADAIFNRRNEVSLESVDKMENAMQNIILQEMENFEGILIATTNLTSALDKAFERRFLFKIEFDKPTPAERKHIWRAMLPEIKPKQALQLAERFDFSGGQIENIARKHIISDILEMRDTLDLNTIIESCQNELITSGHPQVGFTAHS